MSVAELENVTKAWPPISRAVRVPRTEADYRELVELLDRITDEVGEDENHPLASLMDVLGDIIKKYDDAHVPELTEYASSAPTQAPRLPHAYNRKDAEAFVRAGCFSYL